MKELRPSFVVVEGPDGVGKSTLAKRLAESFAEHGEKVCLTMEPSESVIGLAITYALAQQNLPSARTMALLFAADRSFHVENVIQPALDRGEMVICDRYDLSTMVYQIAQGMTGVVRATAHPPFVGPPFQESATWEYCVTWLRRLNDSFPRPDVTLVLKGIAVETAMARIEARKGMMVTFEKTEFQRKVHALYERADKLLRPEEVTFLPVSEDQSPDDVLALAIGSIQLSLHQVARRVAAKQL